MFNTNRIFKVVSTPQCQKDVLFENCRFLLNLNFEKRNVSQLLIIALLNFVDFTLFYNRPIFCQPLFTKLKSQRNREQSRVFQFFQRAPEFEMVSDHSRHLKSQICAVRFVGIRFSFINCGNCLTPVLHPLSTNKSEKTSAIFKILGKILDSWGPVGLSKISPPYFISLKAIRPAKKKRKKTSATSR